MGEWVSVEVSLEPLLEPVDPILQKIDSVLSFLITILNVVQTILNVLKVFLVGLLDPIRATVELIIEEIRNLIRDLRQLGLYLTGDWDLLRSEDRFSNVVGGYQAYERRMLGRLLDRTDPGRPDFSSSSVALGAFFYVSSGDINELVRVLNAFLRFLGQGALAGKSSPYGRPTAPEMRYGTDGASSAAFRGLAASVDELPNAVSVTWSLPDGTGGNGALFNPAPKGFLIHASTIPDGFNVIGLPAKDDKSSRVRDLPRVLAAAVDPTSNGPLKLYGGIADYNADEDLERASEHAPILVLQKDQNTPLIRGSLLQPSTGSGIPFVANTYFVKTSFLTRTGPGAKYTATFPRSLLPRGMTFRAGGDGFAVRDGATFEPTTYWFRIRALTKDYVDQLDSGVLNGATLTNPLSVYDSEVRLFRFSPGKLREARNGVLLPEPPGVDKETALTAQSFTAASSAGVAEFPTEAEVTYRRAVQAAIALVVLCRADLTEALQVLQGTLDGQEFFDTVFGLNVYVPGYGLQGLEGAGRDMMARYGIEPVWFKGTRPQQFRLKMRWLMARISSDLRSRAAPPEAVAAVVLSAAEPLLEFTWDDLDDDYPALTILQSFAAHRRETAGIATNLLAVDETRGLGSNPYCRSKSKKELQAIYEAPNSISEDLAPSRIPSFLTRLVLGPLANSWVPGQGSADFSPILYNDDTGRVEYVRNAILDRQRTDLLDAAVEILQIAGASLSRPSGDTQWIAIRLLPQALIPLDDLLERLDRFLQGILDGLEGIVDKIVAYIEGIQARIYQLQALLEQIRALLRALEFFALPAVSGLVIVESGTDGITRGLVTATNKPFDAANSYGAGIAVVAGGLPSVLLELLALVLGGEQ